MQRGPKQVGDVVHLLDGIAIEEHWYPRGATTFEILGEDANDTVTGEPRFTLRHPDTGALIRGVPRHKIKRPVKRSTC